MTTRFEQQSLEFRKLLDELYELHQGKGGGYGSQEDHYFNIRQSKEFGVAPWLGAIIRQNDKISRIKNFVKNGKLPYESVEDNLKDNAVYAIISLILYREEQKSPQVKEKMEGKVGVDIYQPFLVHSEITGETWEAPPQQQEEQEKK